MDCIRRIYSGSEVHSTHSPGAGAGVVGGGGGGTYLHSSSQDILNLKKDKLLLYSTTAEFKLIQHVGCC